MRERMTKMRKRDRACEILEAVFINDRDDKRAT